MHKRTNKCKKRKFINVDQIDKLNKNEKILPEDFVNDFKIKKNNQKKKTKEFQSDTIFF